MNRNVNSKMATLPSVDIRRSTFDRSFSVKTTFNTSELVPFYLEEVLPGDTFDVTTSRVVRLQTLLTPMMDNLYLSTFYFFVPHRLVWDHWKEFNGENTESAWIPQTEYSIPQLVYDKDALGGATMLGTLWDYFGLPVGEDADMRLGNMSVSALPFRSYACVVENWFRDENLQDPVQYSRGDATTYCEDATGSYITDLELGGYPFKVSKWRDIFTAALPSPQKGPDVTVPVAELGNFPVIPLSDKVNGDLITDPYTAKMLGSGGSGSTRALTFNVSDGSQVSDIQSQTQTGGSLPIIDNLWAIGSTNMTLTTINQLRLAFQIQRLYERDARGGSRYIELIRSHFGVVSPDARLQRPEYLGGNMIPITINQVIQQSESTASSPMGNVAGYSLTTDTNKDFTKSFTEHGYIIGLMCVRYDHTYQQGVDRMWSRKTRFDYYWPALANIGEQSILNKEVYYDATDGKNDEVFGYQEAWYDYRYKKNFVTGEMRSTISNSLDVWHLADDYASRPYLSPAWIEEDLSNVNRVLAVKSNLANQFMADIYVKNKVTRPMPMYSVPGLIDHF